MPERPRKIHGKPARALIAVALPSLLFASLAAAQPRPVAAPHLAAPLSVTSEKDLAATQEELIRLLRLSPTLTTVVEHDPSLLANSEYVRRNNPQLAQYLDSHPEIALNPDFYLFTKMKEGDGGPDRALERAVWPEFSQPRQEPNMLQWLINEVGPFVVVMCLLGAVLWLLRQFVENRRWGRIFKLQADVHGKLIDKFSQNSSQELLVYMESDAGRRFLEAAPLPVNFEQEERMPGMVSRVLVPLQIGIVLSLLGLGFLFLQRIHPGLKIPMMVLGTVVLMPGLGFILSAGITWVLAGRLGMIPNGEAHPAKATRPLDLRDGQ